jgi:hypothetical protein
MIERLHQEAAEATEESTVVMSLVRLLYRYTRKATTNDLAYAMILVLYSEYCVLVQYGMIQVQYDSYRTQAFHEICEHSYAHTLDLEDL